MTSRNKNQAVASFDLGVDPIEMPRPLAIINPFQEQKDKEARDGLIADTKNLARNLVLQHLISPSEAFDRVGRVRICVDIVLE